MTDYVITCDDCTKGLANFIFCQKHFLESRNGLEDTFHRQRKNLIETQINAVEILKIQAEYLAYLIRETTDYSRETSLAITKLEECIMWAVKGITK